ncbi:LysR substrate-binding domain-containing protein [Polycladidibacter stylochi]|uniref:LysR substrate-binding domain-containing protein n=1 Tax=Polycladidibacter stylochi TaxID=1807766 RepID=UPI000833EFF8|nr:LysR substrate-binding domain-containing protein [Pseudovibrio stylochi]
MAQILDLDQLKTLVAIIDCGSFTRAAEKVSKTQSAVSMQMRRLEERIGKPIFERDGRNSKLTEDGERLLHYARRIVQLHDETLSVFDENVVSGSVRLGTPDDYADRFLPEILARFSRSHPQAEVQVVCAPTPNLKEMYEKGDLDLSIVTHVKKNAVANEQIIRREPLLWVGSERHFVEQEDTLPLALGRVTCDWRIAAISALEDVKRKHRVLYTSWNSTAVCAAVLAGLAVTVLPESAIRTGMRVLDESQGFPRLPICEIALLQNWTTPSVVADALADHIKSSLDNISLQSLPA